MNTRLFLGVLLVTFPAPFLFAAEEEGVEDTPTEVHTQAREIIAEIQTGLDALTSGILSGIYAKELCSCHFILDVPLQTCKQRARLPRFLGAVIHVSKVGESSIVAHPIINRTAIEKELARNYRVTSPDLRNGIEDLFETAQQGVPEARAEFNRDNPQFGCTLVSNAAP